MAARHLEAHGIPTVILGSAIDIVEHCGVPRFHFVDFPLGNPCGRPFDLDMQRKIVGDALSLFESATGPRSVVFDDHQWGHDNWRDRYMQINPEDRERLRLAGEERRVERQRMREEGQVRKT